MSILLIDFADITIEQLLSQLDPAISGEWGTAELACRYDIRQGWVVGYVVQHTSKWLRHPLGEGVHCDQDLKRALWLLKRDLEGLGQ